MFIDQAVKSLCDIWHPQDIPHEFMTLLHATVAVVPSYEQLPSLMTKPAKRPFHNQNIQQLPNFPPDAAISHPFISIHTPQQSPHSTTDL
jgi:hypothetical protein